MPETAPVVTLDNLTVTYAKNAALRDVTTAFARGVKRDDLTAGAELLGMPLEEHITNVIGFMRERADLLGLRGTL